MADESVDTGGAYIGFRATNIKLEDPPEIDDELTLLVKVECVGDGHQKMADGELRERRVLRVLWVGPVGSKPPTDPQTGLFDKGGNITPEAAGDDFEASADEGDEIIAARREAAADEDDEDAES